MTLRMEEIITLDEETTNIYGMNSTTKEALDRFQNILERLLDILKTNEENIEYNKNFDAKIIKKKILAEFEHGCKGSSSHVVILEPTDNLNSDQAILEAANMYRADFNLQENGYLDIVANEAIFCQLMRCQAQFFQLRPLLRQWHTLKDFCSVLIVLFSSYGLLNLARKLDENNDTHILLKVWYLYYQWAGIWKVHRIGMRIGNHNLQQDALSAASPLFPSAGKSNYALAIAQHLSTLTKYPRLNEILQYVGAFRIPKNNDNKNEDQKPVCFGFDEALETFGVHFSERAIDSRSEVLWKLIEDLVIIFDMIDPLSHEIFKDLESLELYKEEYERLVACYKNGLERMQVIYKQDVIKIKFRNVQGRRALKIQRTRHKDYAEKKKTERKARRRQKHDKEVFHPEPQVDKQESKK
ncbi:hypothetical protein RhiirA1_403288 [Rhizophagus irregularis]|uniref:Uncharacterized protein n=1 Tax=Rhizophagus irregularis TaxID=588596 RepID=A0A2N0QV05_9GLOM|nr:hypothetical protein RhiirA1_403288 [Rhizophagus irregularis]